MAEVGKPTQALVELGTVEGNDNNGGPVRAADLMERVADVMQRINGATHEELIDIAEIELGISEVSDLRRVVAVSSLMRVVAPEDQNGHSNPEVPGFVTSEVQEETSAEPEGTDQKEPEKPGEVDGDEQPATGADTTTADKTEQPPDDVKYSEGFELPDYPVIYRGIKSQKRIAFETVVGFFDEAQAQQEDGRFEILKGDSTSASKLLVQHIEEELKHQGIENPYSTSFRQITLGAVLRDLAECDYLVIEKSPNGRSIEAIRLGEAVKKN